MTNGDSSFKIIFRKYYGNNFMGGFFMSEKMLVTQALDERDLLVKKISENIVWNIYSGRSNFLEKQTSRYGFL